jgi:uroporphyrin-III C-methyltransferase / precorrin-2 dehydrogenase / sirohydrochlorin ferrochelatase
MRDVPPIETRPARMNALAVLPVFFDLKDRRVAVAGSGDGLLWKTELLAAAGANVDVFTTVSSADLDALCASPPAGSIRIIERDWRGDDLGGASLAVGALVGEQAAAFAIAARERGVPVNIVDAPDISTFSFGTIVNRSPVVIGISTAGVAPVLGQAIRAKIEALLHSALAAWAAAAARLRATINARFAMGPTRRDAWRRFADRALAARSAPTSADLSAAERTASVTGGSVALVGAGPGDPELLTLKALRALQSADIILYDRLVSPEILELARREARRMLVGKAGNGPRCRQDDINALMVKLARSGQRVVRLKGGDPMVFGRAAEEIEICRAAGIPVEVVPGITAALGAAAELQIPLTDRRRARRLQFITGHTEAGGPPACNWTSVADPQTVTVFYMGAGTFGRMLPELIAAGLPPDTPALAVASATTPRSTHVRCAVSALPAALERLDRSEPCLIMLGKGLRGGEAEAEAAAAAAGLSLTASA